MAKYKYNQKMWIAANNAMRPAHPTPPTTIGKKHYVKKKCNSKVFYYAANGEWVQSIDDAMAYVAESEAIKIANDLKCKNKNPKIEITMFALTKP